MSPDIQTSTGRFFHFDRPVVNTWDIHEIAHALSNLCRFTGHCREFYSVAQHSVLVSHIVPPAHALAGLLHDAAEAYVGDMASPLKMLMPQYKDVERALDAIVSRAFRLPYPMPECVKEADLIALATEQRDLMPAGVKWEMLEGIRPRDLPIKPQLPREAFNGFMARYRELTGNPYRELSA